MNNSLTFTTWEGNNIAISLVFGTGGNSFHVTQDNYLLCMLHYIARDDRWAVHNNGLDTADLTALQETIRTHWKF